MANSTCRNSAKTASTGNQNTSVIPFPHDKRVEPHLRNLVLCGEIMLMKLEDLDPDDMCLDHWRRALEDLRNSRNV